jgi:hypothetical protein
MPATAANVIRKQIVATEQAAAKAWLVRRLAWEHRLRELETDRDTKLRPS